MINVVGINFDREKMLILVLEIWLGLFYLFAKFTFGKFQKGSIIVVFQRRGCYAIRVLLVNLKFQKRRKNISKFNRRGFYAIRVLLVKLNSRNDSKILLVLSAEAVMLFGFYWWDKISETILKYFQF